MSLACLDIAEKSSIEGGKWVYEAEITNKDRGYRLIKINFAEDVFKDYKPKDARVNLDNKSYDEDVLIFGSRTIMLNTKNLKEVHITENVRIEVQFDKPLNDEIDVSARGIYLPF